MIPGHSEAQHADQQARIRALLTAPDQTPWAQAVAAENRMK